MLMKGGIADPGLEPVKEIRVLSLIVCQARGAK